MNALFLSSAAAAVVFISSVQAGAPEAIRHATAMCLATRAQGFSNMDCSPGVPGINQAQCENLGCCWDTTNTASNTSTPGSGPYCFKSSHQAILPPSTANTPAICDATIAQFKATPSVPLVEGGFPGISSDDCSIMNMCWDSNSGGPWCFLPSSNFTAQPWKMSATPEHCLKRQARGNTTTCAFSSTINQESCESLNCCWTDSPQAGNSNCFNLED